MASDDQMLREDIESLLRAQVRCGFRSREEIWRAVDEICEDGDNPDALRRHAAAELDRLWSAQRAEEATWEARTDCDRLNHAFDELETTGIVCRQDFACCGTCGAAEIGGEFGALEARGLRVRGYAFYHEQDTEAAADGHGLYLNYGAIKNGVGASLEIAREVVSVLQAHGLKTVWNGQWNQRIHVPLQWRRRFVCGPTNSPQR
jgi:hypothetical protein